MRVMAIDYGDRRTGLAFSDMTATICGDAFTVEEHKVTKLIKRIKDECATREVGSIVIGLPRNMDGSEGERAEKCRAFAKLVEDECALPVHLRDERLSSVQAHAILRQVGKKEIKHKKSVDAVAASLILESYLNSK